MITEEQKREALEDLYEAHQGEMTYADFVKRNEITIRALLQPAIVDAPEECCKGCPKDEDCEDYRTDGNPCEGKTGWFKCDECGKLLPTQNGLEKHKRYHAPVDAEVMEAVEIAKHMLKYHPIRDQRAAIIVLIRAVTKRKCSCGPQQACNECYVDGMEL